MLVKENITGLLLAGGKSSRMGEDKGLLLLHDKTFTEHILEAMYPLVSEIIISSNNREYDNFGLRRIEDDIENEGPIVGLYSGLKAAKTEFTLVLSCDVPLIKSDILKLLITNFDNSYDALVFQQKNQIMPLVGLYKSHCGELLKTVFDSEERRLLNALKSFKLKIMPLEETSMALTNVNTPAELNKIKSWS